MPASGLPGGGRISQWIPGPIVVVERSTLRTVDRQEFKVSTPGRVFYLATGTTKREVIDYYLAVADVMLPHLSGRPATRKRWSDGVDGPELCAKDIELGTQEWMTRVQIRHSSGPKFYPIINGAGLGWLGQVAARSCMCRSGGSRRPPAPAASLQRRRSGIRIGWCSTCTPVPVSACPSAPGWRCTCGNAGRLGERTVPVTSGTHAMLRSPPPSRSTRSSSEKLSVE